MARKGRDAGTPFAVQLLIYPSTSSRQDAPSYSMYAFGYGLTRDAMAWYWKQYIGDYDGSTDPDISPAALQDLRRMPRAIVITAEADILRDEAESYAQRTFLAGVDTEGYCYDGMIHGFLRMAGVVDRSNQALGEIAESLKPFLDKTWRDDYSVTLDPKEIMAGIAAEARDARRDAELRLALLAFPRFERRAALRLRRLRLGRQPLLAAPLLAVRRLGHRALVCDRVEVGAALGRGERRERLLGALRVGVRADALELPHRARELGVLLLDRRPARLLELLPQPRDLREPEDDRAQVAAVPEARQEDHDPERHEDREQDEERDEEEAHRSRS